MQVKSVMDPSFRKYGRVLKIETPDLLERLAKTPAPADEVIYVASAPELEACAEYAVIRDSIYGGMPTQVGYCNGFNKKLNAVEYHRDSEINIALDGAILIVGSEQDIEDDFTYDTAKMEAFEVPAGGVVEVYGTTLHYAPCSVGDKPFRVVIILPAGTNTDAPVLTGVLPEEKLLTHKNKWLIAHPEAGIEGAFAGLKGENLEVK